MSKYHNVKPIGQIDKYACWAACLSWWLIAMNRQDKKTQTDLIKIYDNGLLTDSNGAVLPLALEQRVFPDFKLKMMTASKNDLTLYQFNEPALIIFRNPAVGGLHMNVVFDSRAGVSDGGDGKTNISAGAMTMEPFYPMGERNGNKTGIIIFRPFSYFTQAASEVYLGVSK